MTLAVYEPGPPSASSDSEAMQALARRMDETRLAMESEMSGVRQKAQTYLNWYSPPYEPRLGTHDAWTDPFLAENVGLTRANFPIVRPCVDIWTALEFAKPPTIWAEPERVMAPAPSLDQATELERRLVAEARKKVAAIQATVRAQRIRAGMRRDSFAYQAFLAGRRKNLYGFSWTKVWPHATEPRTVSYTLRNPTTVFPIWSDREPGDIEAVLVAYQVNVNKANAMYDLGIPTKRGQILTGRDSGEYRDLTTNWYDATRTMLWVEEYWWREQRFDNRGAVTESAVHMVVRIANRIVKAKTYRGWTRLPWVYWENADERDAYGWSDVANVIDINDEFNRRLSQEGDIIGSYSAPRFQLLNSFAGRTIEMPGPFELISLNDQERIEQILTRIDMFPTQQHFNILTDLLHRASGLPPIVWGLIANAQTSGRALSASWKATETRLAPKLIRNERSFDQYLELNLMFAELYDWKGARGLYTDRDGDRFRDFRWEFPPMEPRDFMEVTQNEITKRDAGLTSTLKAIRATGDEAAEDTLEEVLAEYLSIFMHPDKVQAFLLAQRAEMDNIAYAQQLGVNLQPGGGVQGGSPVNPATVANAVGMARDAASAGAAPAPAAGPAPATAPGAPANAGGPAPTPPGQPAGIAPGSAGEGPGASLSSGTLVRNGQVSNQQLLQQRY